MSRALQCWSAITQEGMVPMNLRLFPIVVDCKTKEIVRMLDAGQELKRTQAIDVPID